MSIELIDAIHHAKVVARTVAICLLNAGGDPDLALERLAAVSVVWHEDPVVSDMTRSLVEQAIREGVAAVAA